LILLLGGLLLTQLACFGLPILLVFGIWWLIYINSTAYRKEKHRRKRAWHAADRELYTNEQEWRRLASAYESQFLGLKERLDGHRRQHSQLQPLYTGERRQLERNQESLACEQHLRTCFITDHDIQGIGPGRERVLASYGVETAFDIEENRIRAIKGFKDALTRNLLQWRKEMLGAFRFDPRTGVPEPELRRLALKYKQQENLLFAQLEHDVVELQRLNRQYEQEFGSLEGQIQELLVHWAQARADLEECSR
jgi:DNA-binding helix-hairpin-helix protein with protein kinase domain